MYSDTSDMKQHCQCREKADDKQCETMPPPLTPFQDEYYMGLQYTQIHPGGAWCNDPTIEKRRAFGRQTGRNWFFLKRTLEFFVHGGWAEGEIDNYNILKYSVGHPAATDMAIQENEAAG